jgi:ankyrin repeat protein
MVRECTIRAGDPEATERFKRVAEAYEVLCEDQQVICQFFSEEDFLYAADEGDLEEVRSLLEAGVDIFTTNKHGFTALHKAAQRGASTPYRRCRASATRLFLALHSSCLCHITHAM